MYLGLFTLIALGILTVFVYLIGDKQDLFTRTFRLHAVFEDVSGLTGGNNVRYAGIDVGTVADVRIVSDSGVIVEMDVQADVQRYIRTDAHARIGTDGLMGNKLVLITNAKGHKGRRVQDGDTLRTEKDVEVTELLTTFSRTNDNLEVISREILDLLGDLKNEDGIFHALLSDSTLTGQVQGAIATIREGGAEFARLGREINRLVGDLEEGQGAAGAVLRDSSLQRVLTDGLGNFERAGRHSAAITEKLDDILRDLAEGKGTAVALLRDTVAGTQLDSILSNLMESSQRVNTLLEAARHNFLFRRYFRRLEKGKRE